MFCGKGGRERAGEESGGGESGREIRGYWQIGGKFYSFICLLFFLLFLFKGKKPYLYFTGNFFSFFQTRFLLSFTV